MFDGVKASVFFERWMADGYVYNTPAEGYNYELGVSYMPEGGNHYFNVLAFGSPQTHLQKDLWTSYRDLELFGKDGLDRRLNSNGGIKDGKVFSMRQNFYHKPFITASWDWKIGNNFHLATVFDYSIGMGGGTGPRGQAYNSPTIDVRPFRRGLTNQVQMKPGLLRVGYGSQVEGYQVV